MRLTALTFRSTNYAFAAEWVHSKDEWATPMTEEQFDMLLTGILERPIEKMSDEEVVHRMSVTQAAVDRLLNELERRGLLTFASDGAPIIPFDVPDSRYVETILTRD